MALQNTQFDAIMRSYDRRQIQNRRSQEERIREVYEKIPRIEEIQQTIISVSTQKARDLLMKRVKDTGDLEEQISLLSEEKYHLLREHGYPADYLDMHYQCPACRDTGFIDGKKCICLKNAIMDLLYDQSNIREILEKENFETFSFDWYSDKIVNETTGKTPLEHARFAVQRSMEFVEFFSELHPNLFIYGDTGVGKTFLSHCIARELIKKGERVLYFSAYDLFHFLAVQAFSREEEASSFTFESVCEADLLIIDDLGTEMTNSFVKTQLFSILNERLTHRKSTIISTNYDMETFSNVYTTRIFSRIIQNFTLLNLIGKDIRVQKALGGNDK